MGNDPEAFGAVGDGVTDDTKAIQAAIDSAASGSGVVRLRPGTTYAVLPATGPKGGFGGIALRSGVTLDLAGASLRALPVESGVSSVVQALRADGWSIRGPGAIVGERDRHLGKTGEWGHGVLVRACRNWTIEAVAISDCWGDGIYVGHTGSAGEGGGDYSDDWVIGEVSVERCRRNGLSIVSGRRGLIRAPRIRDIRGIAPQAGIDLEPDQQRFPQEGITIEDAQIADCVIGIGASMGNRGVRIIGGSISASNSGIMLGSGSADFLIEGATIESTAPGREGAALRTIADGSTIERIRVRDNVLRGGGFFVVDTRGPGIEIVGNDIQARGAGVQGVARMLGGGTFSDNRCVIEAGAGTRERAFIQFSDVAQGRNRYDNRSGKAMYAFTAGGRRLGADTLSNALREKP